MQNSRHLHWNAEALWRQLEPLLPGMSVEVIAQAESTNTRLLDRARRLSGQRDAPITRPGQLDDGEPAAGDGARPPYGRRAGDTQPCLLVAEHQTRGRGRLGRDWQSGAGLSLTFSLSLPLAPREWSGLSLAVGLALADALDPPVETPPRIGLKWPNDLWLLDAPGAPTLGRKLGGILIETVAVGSRRMCVVGIGLNVLPQPADGLSSGFACLQEIDPQASAPAALATVAAPLLRALCRFETEGFASFATGFARRDLLRGQRVTANTSEPLEGIAEGVDERGALRVRSGVLHTVVGGEVSVRLQDGAEC